jgi:menaquinone-dependent protoporphyrinogen oxidase
MTRILIVYGTFDGQTLRIAERIGAVLTASGHAITLRDAQWPLAASDIRAHDAVVVGGAIRYGKFPRALERFARTHAAALGACPTAFFCVCMAARDPARGPEAAGAYTAKFVARTGWKPDVTASFAGALQYTRYNPFIRLMMRLISGSQGGNTDTSRDHEYTDWNSVERFARDVAARFTQPGRAAA